MIKITEEDNKKIAAHYPGGEHDFYSQDLEEENKKDAQDWLDKGELKAIVSEEHGGIIGYIHSAYIEDHVSVLNLRMIEQKDGKMLKVVKKEWEEITAGYTLTLEDGDKVFIPESKYDFIQTYTSVHNKKLKAVVDEHEDNYEEPIEYLGFKIIS